MNIITRPEQLDELVSHYTGRDFAFDVETVGSDRLNTLVNEVSWLSMATHGRVDVIPLGHPNGEFLGWDRPLLKSGRDRLEKGLEVREKDYSTVESKWRPMFSDPPAQLRPDQVWEPLKPLFMDPSVIKVAHNAKFDLKSVHKYLGGTPVGPYFDTMIASFVLDPTAEKGLDKVLRRVFSYEMAKGVGKRVEDHCFDDVAEYAGLDARWTWLLASYQSELLQSENLLTIFDLEMETLEAVISMELHGIRIDVDSLVPLKESLEEQINLVTMKVFEAAGKTFNINSNAEKQKILFDPKSKGGQGLTPAKRTEGGAPSVDSESLSKFPNNKVCVHLLEYADLNKLLTTYVTPYTGGTRTRTTNGKTTETYVPSILQQGRIHGSFNQIGAETGRFSSSHPNLQNVPNPRTPNGRKIRNLFVADEGHRLVVADYSQIEPRVIASLSRDPDMIRAFIDGDDIYTAIAEPLGVDRASGKELVLSIAYGIGPPSIAERLGIKVSEARDLMTDFSTRFRSIDRLRLKTITRAKSRNPIPYVETLFGRRRPIPLLSSEDPGELARGERQVFNTLIQGTAADIAKKALVRIHTSLPREAQLLLTVHDEFVVTSPQGMVEEVSEVVRGAMTGIDVLEVPLEIDLKVVDRWGEAK